METLLGFTVLLIALHAGGTFLIIRYFSGIRNGAGLLVGLLSAYVFSIALDNIWAPLISAEPLSVVPVIAGTAYGLGFYYAARKLVKRAIAARSAYYLIGILALIASLVGHKHSLAVGASMVVLGIVLPFETITTSTPCRQLKNSSQLS